MNIAGLTIVALVVVLGLYLAPTFAAKRRAILQSREGDRFSPHLRVLSDDNQDVPARRDGHSPLQLLASPARGGISVDTSTVRKPVAPSVRARRLDAAAAREMAALRSARASRVSGEAAASKRRFAGFLVSVLILAVVAGLSAASVISWWWVSLPAVILVANIIGSRYAARLVEQANAADKARLEELRAMVPVRQKPAVLREESTLEENLAQLPETVVAETLVEEVVAAAPAEVEIVAESPQEVPPPAAEPTEWEVRALPAPVYASKSKVTRRSVHVDTDIKGIPQIVAATPGRPVEASPLPSESAPITFSFDLNAVLESRRAQ